MEGRFLRHGRYELRMGELHCFGRTCTARTTKDRSLITTACVTDFNLKRSIHGVTRPRDA